MTDKVKDTPRMQFNTTLSSDPAQIREQAERKIKFIQQPEFSSMTSEEIQQLFHELQIKHIEAGLQNEQLRSQLQERDDQAAMFRIVNENMLDMVALTDVEGNFTFVGKSHEILGYDPDFLFGKNVMDFVHPEDFPLIMNEFSGFVASGHSRRVEYRYRCEDGTYLWFETVGNFITNKKGIPQKIIFTSRNITERKQVEETARKTEGILKDIFESTLSGFWDWNLVDNTEHLSPTFKRMFGYEDHEMESSPEAWQRIIFPEDLPGVLAVFDQHVKSLGQEAFYNEVRYRHRDGSTVWVICAGRVIEWTQDGAPIRMVGCHIDITERKRAEEALRESEKSFRKKIQAILEPQGDIGELSLGDFIDHQALQSMMEEFYRITNLPSAMVDISGKTLISAGWQDICVNFHRSHPDTMKNCHEAATILANGVAAGTFRVHRCKNNLRDIVTPIEISGNHMGNIFVGQFFYEDEIPDYDLFRSQACQYGFDETEYLAALDRVPRLSRELVETAMSFYSKMADMISSLSYSKIKLSRTLTERKRAEVALRESNRRFRQLFESSPISLWVQDFSEVKKRIDELKEKNVGDLGPYLCHRPELVWELAGMVRVLDVNRSTVALYRAETKQEFFSGITQILSPESLEGFIEFLLAIARGEKGVVTERDHLTIDGNSLKVQLHWAVVEGFESCYSRVIISNVDITGQKQAEAALHKERLRLENIIDGAQVGTWEWNIQTGETMVNKTWAELAGHTLDELSPFNIDTWDSLTHPDDLEKAKKLIGLHVAGELPMYDNEIRMLHKAGHWVWMQGRGKVVQWTTDGKPLMMYGTHTDITERKQAEQQLRESEQKYRFMTEQMNDVVWTSDLEMRITYISPSDERILGFTPEERIKHTLVDMLTPFSQEKAMAVISKEYSLEETGRADFHRSVSIELEYRHKDGSTRWLETLATGIRDDEGRLIGLHGVSRNITERKQAEEESRKLHEQLTQAQKMESVGRLAGGVAHDFNNKLAIINGYAEVAMEMIDPSDPLYEMIQEIHTAGEQSADIVRQLLAFARQQTISPVLLDLNDTISFMLKMLQRLIGENIDLTWHPGKNLWPVKIDPSQVDQIMANLAVNSRDAISDVGKLSIETKNTVVDEDYCKTNPEAIPGRYVMLSVSDDGHGIKKEIKGQLFEPFFTTKAIGKGTGLGLSTIYGIIKQNKGFINVYSEPEEGTTFKLYFPSCETEKSFVHAAKNSSGQMPTGTESILIVEDEKTILQISKKRLDRLGYTVQAAENPSEALQFSEEHDGTIDLLITDVVMPEMNGKDLSSRLTQIHPGLKTLYMSGYTADVIAHHGVLDEGVQFIQKPFSLKDLAAKVREMIDQK